MHNEKWGGSARAYHVQRRHRHARTRGGTGGGARVSLLAVADHDTVAGGVASLAHPCKLKIDDEATVRALADAGLWGLEAYYGDGGEAYIPRALELARRYGLRPTIGSDYHGAYRASALGMRAPNHPALRETLGFLENMKKTPAVTAR